MPMKYSMHSSYEFLLTHINILSLYARHCSNYLLNITSVNPHNNSMTVD